MNYKFGQHAKKTCGSSYVNYHISLLGRDLREQGLMQKHLKILEDMIKSVSGKIKRENMQIVY